MGVIYVWHRRQDTVPDVVKRGIMVRAHFADAGKTVQICRRYFTFTFKTSDETHPPVPCPLGCSNGHCSKKSLTENQPDRSGFQNGPPQLRASSFAALGLGDDGNTGFEGGSSGRTCAKTGWCHRDGNSFRTLLFFKSTVVGSMPRAEVSGQVLDYCWATKKGLASTCSPKQIWATT